MTRKRPERDSNFSIERNGKEVFRYVGKNNGDRYSFEQLESKLLVLN